jgi:hypothetical protein
MAHASAAILRRLIEVVYSMFARSILVFVSLSLASTLAACSGAAPGSPGSLHQEDTGPTSCEDTRVTCPSATHCEMKGLNGSAVPVCINDASVCAGATCPTGTHCEAKGINGGVVPACIKDPVNDPSCPSSEPEYGAPCAKEGLACAYAATECGEPSVRDVTCVEGRWHFYALGACPP